jgi:hypothetical protein
VRFNVAKEFHPLSEALGKNITLSDGLGSFCNLLQDAEAEVRAAAAKNIGGYLDLVGVENFVQVAVIKPTGAHACLSPYSACRRSCRRCKFCVRTWSRTCEVSGKTRVVAPDTDDSVVIGCTVVVATACMAICPKLGEEVAITHIVPLLEIFLKDESHEVRSRVLVITKII